VSFALPCYGTDDELTARQIIAVLKAPAQPPRKPDARAGGRGIDIDKMTKFKELARRLVRVPKSELDEARNASSPVVDRERDDPS
jgi:hypothetical protein